MDSYIAELEGQYAESDPLTMDECADVAKKCLTKRLNVSHEFSSLFKTPFCGNRIILICFYHNRLYFLRWETSMKAAREMSFL